MPTKPPPKSPRPVFKGDFEKIRNMLVLIADELNGVKG